MPRRQHLSLGTEIHLPEQLCFHRLNIWKQKHSKTCLVSCVQGSQLKVDYYFFLIYFCFPKYRTCHGFILAPDGGSQEPLGSGLLQHWLWKPARFPPQKRPGSGLLHSNKEEVLPYQVRELHWWSRSSRKSNEKPAKQFKIKIFKLECVLFSHKIKGIMDGNITYHLNINAL